MSAASSLTHHSAPIMPGSSSAPQWRGCSWVSRTWTRGVWWGTRRAPSFVRRTAPLWACACQRCSVTRWDHELALQ